MTVIPPNQDSLPIHTQMPRVQWTYQGKTYVMESVGRSTFKRQQFALVAVGYSTRGVQAQKHRMQNVLEQTKRMFGENASQIATLEAELEAFCANPSMPPKILAFCDKENSAQQSLRLMVCANYDVLLVPTSELSPA